MTSLHTYNACHAFGNSRAIILIIRHISHASDSVEPRSQLFVKNQLLRRWRLLSLPKIVTVTKTSRVENLRSEWNGKLEPNVTTNIHKPMVAKAMKCNHHFSLGIWVASTILLWIWRLALGIWWWLLSTLEFSCALHWFLTLSMNTRIMELERAKLTVMWTVQTCIMYLHLERVSTFAMSPAHTQYISVRSQYIDKRRQSGKGILLELQWLPVIVAIQCNAQISYLDLQYHILYHSQLCHLRWLVPKAQSSLCQKQFWPGGLVTDLKETKEKQKTTAKLDPFWFFRLGYHLSEISTARNLIQ